MAKDYPINEIENATDDVEHGYKIIEVVDEKAKQTTYDILKDGKLVWSTVTRPLAMAWLEGCRFGGNGDDDSNDDKDDKNSKDDTNNKLKPDTKPATKPGRRMI